MSFTKFCFVLFITSLSFSASFAQSSPKITTLPRADKAYIPLENIRLTAAYAEIVLRRADLESELEALLVTYTEDFPKVKEIRFEMENLKKEFSRLSAVKPTEISKLTSALGKLVIKKAELETDLWSLQLKYGDAHAEVKRAKKRVEIYENAIKSILE